MKKFYIKIVLFASLVVCIVVAAAGYLKACCLDDDYMLEQPVKVRLAASTRSPKLVLLGGSNVAFGIDSHAVSDSLHIATVNVGLHAGMGLRYTVDRFVPYLNAGDILVVCPEYCNFFGNGAYGEAPTMWLLPLCDAQGLWVCNLSPKQLENIVALFPTHVFRRIAEGLRQKRREPSQTAVAYRYVRSGFDDIGDEVSHLTLPPEVSSIPDDGGVAGTFNEAYYNYLLREVAALQRRGVAVCFLPPCISAREYRREEPQATYLARRLSSDGVGFLVSPSAFTYPDSCLYNTCYHLNRQGRIAHTRRVITALRTAPHVRCRLCRQ